MGYTLGISAYYHDSAAVLTRDGEILAAAQEERFSRKKGDERFPRNAVAYCLQSQGLVPADLEAVVFYDKPIVKFDRILASHIHRAPLSLRSFLKAIPLWLSSKLWTEDLILKELPGFGKKILFTDHHQSHAASAFFPSPFESACVVTVDGAGEWTTTTIGIGRGNTLRQLQRIRFPHSLGLLYSAFTYYCGFRVNSGEYKLMGLAPYGVPRFTQLIKSELVRIADDGSFTLNERYFDYIGGLKMINRRFERLFGRPALRPEAPSEGFYWDVAASVQKVTEEILVGICRRARELTREPNLCLAGGVALNCVANSKILQKAGFERLWIQPAASDAGGALGAALYHDFAYKNLPRRTDGVKDSMKGSFLGPEASPEEIESVLIKQGAVFHRYKEEKALLERACELLAEGKVLGWVRGRMEFGPRALGARSIIGDARRPEMQSVMNLKIKFRESFRPFAPAVLAERAKEIFEFHGESPYMLMVAPVREAKRIPAADPDAVGMDLLRQQRSEYPAVTHVDHSARLQTVGQDGLSPLRPLLEVFEAKTGSPVLINTSFNVRGEPIVCSPADAFRCFLGTGMDALVLGPFLLLKAEQTVSVDQAAWKKSWIKD